MPKNSLNCIKIPINKLIEYSTNIYKPNDEWLVGNYWKWLLQDKCENRKTVHYLITVM